MITIDLIERPSSKHIPVNNSEVLKHVDQKISDLVGGAPEHLDTLKELSDILIPRFSYNNEQLIITYEKP